LRGVGRRSRHATRAACIALDDLFDRRRDFRCDDRTARVLADLAHQRLEGRGIAALDELVDPGEAEMLHAVHLERRRPEQLDERARRAGQNLRGAEFDQTRRPARRRRGQDLNVAEHARRARESFNKRFWFEQGGYLYDVVDGERGDDTSCRPNQVFAISLPHPVLDRDRWEPVMNVVRQRLLTPAGLRSLAPGEKDYKARYYGDLRARDAAYHQGTVWPWLMGPFVDAWLAVHPEDLAGARTWLTPLLKHVTDGGCVGSVSEIFDAEAPFTPRGCFAQAWSVAELARLVVKLGVREADVAETPAAAGARSAGGA